MLARGVLVLSLALPPGSPQTQSADDQYHFLVALEEKGLHDTLVREARTFLREHADHPKAALARYRLAGALYELDRPEEARVEYAALSKLAGFEFAGEVDLRLGQCELARESLDGARVAFERVRAHGQGYLHTPATFLLAETHFRGKDFAAAEPLYLEVQRASDAAEFAREAEHALAWCAFQTSRWDEAGARAQRFLERHHDDAFADELAWLAGESCLEAGRPQDAASWFARVRAGPHHADALRGSAFAAAALDDHRRSAGFFARLIEEHPDSRWKGEAQLHRGIQLLKAEDPAAALDALQRAPDGSESGYWRARAVAALGRHDEALASLGRALTQRPSEEVARRIHVARGDSLSALGRGAEAAKAWETGGSEYGLQSAALSELAAGRPKEAVRLAEELLGRELAAEPRREAELVRAEALFALADYASAEQAFQRVLAAETEPARVARALSRLSWCRYLVGDFAESAKRFAALAASHPRAPEAEEARFLEARSLESCGEAKRAAAAFGRYLENHPDAPRTNEAMLRLARLEGADGKARLETLLARRPEPEIALAASYELAERLSGEESFAEAEAHYRAVLDQGGGSDLVPRATYGLAWARHAQSESADAARLLRGLLAKKELDPELTLSALELLIWAERGAKNPDGARAAFDVFCARTNDETRRLASAKVTALALSEAGRPGDAQKVYEKLSRASDPALAARATLERAWLDIDLGQPSAAEAKARAALEVLPEELAVRECLFFVGEAWYEGKDDPKAIACYQLAQDHSTPDVASRAMYKCGFAHLRAGDLSAAARSFGQLIERFPQSDLSGESLYLWGEAEARAGRFEAAAPPLLRMRKDFPRHAAWGKAMLRLSEALARTERWREAADVSAELLRREPEGEGAVQAELWHARALAALGERRGAEAAFRHVVDKDRGQLSAQARIALGSMSVEAGDLEGALSEFLKVALLYAHEEEVAEALYRAGEVLEKQGESEQALVQWREAAKHEETAFGRRARQRLASR